MERLWSPWRSHYISSVKDATAELCVFCAAHAVENDESRFIVHRGKTAFIIMNLYPYNDGHLLVIPNRHGAEMADLHPEERLEMMDLATFGMSLLKESLAPQGFNLGANLGRIAGAGIVDHLHFHIVPRWNGDTNFMPVLADTKLISEGMNDTYARLMLARTRLLG